jgi:hypothetical protein
MIPSPQRSLKADRRDLAFAAALAAGVASKKPATA